LSYWQKGGVIGLSAFLLFELIGWIAVLTSSNALYDFKIALGWAIYLSGVGYVFSLINAPDVIAFIILGVLVGYITGIIKSRKK